MALLLIAGIVLFFNLLLVSLLVSDDRWTPSEKRGSFVILLPNIVLAVLTLILGGIR